MLRDAREHGDVARDRGGAVGDAEVRGDAGKHEAVRGDPEGPEHGKLRRGLVGVEAQGPRGRLAPDEGVREQIKAGKVEKRR